MWRQTRSRLFVLSQIQRNWRMSNVRCAPERKETAMTSTHDFPTTGVELRYLLVASDYARSLAFYRDVLGATVVREISDTLCLLSFGGSEIMLTVGGEPTKDKPTVTFSSPTDIN